LKFIVIKKKQWDARNKPKNATNEEVIQWQRYSRIIWFWGYYSQPQI